MANIVIKVKKEKQQINFLNCDKINEWKDTCQYRYGEYVGAVYYVRYTTTDNKTLVPYTTNGWGATYIDTIYQNGSGYVLFETQPTIIPPNAFKGCTTLKTLYIDDNITSIGATAFDGCSNLTTIYAFSTNVASITDTTFKNIGMNGTLYYPEGIDYSSWLGEEEETHPQLTITSVEGNWSRDNNSFTSNTITHNETTVERINFSVNKDCYLKFDVNQSSEYGYDYLIVGKIDSEVINTTASTNNSFNAKGVITSSFTVSVTEGNHYIEMMYRKDVSVSQGTDNVSVAINATTSTNTYKLRDYNWNDEVLTLQYSSTTVNKCEGYNYITETTQLLSYDGIDWKPYGDTVKVVEQYSQHCGYVPPTKDVVSYKCENGDTYSNKVKITEHLISYDNKQTWVTASTDSEIIQTNCPECGYRTKTEITEPYCDSSKSTDYAPYARYVDTEYYKSYNFGDTWIKYGTETDKNRINVTDYEHYINEGEIITKEITENISLDCIPETSLIVTELEDFNFKLLYSQVFEYSNGEIPTSAYTAFTNEHYKTAYIGKSINYIQSNAFGDTQIELKYIYIADRDEYNFTPLQINSDAFRRSYIMFIQLPRVTRLSYNSFSEMGNLRFIKYRSTMDECLNILFEVGFEEAFGTRILRNDITIACTDGTIVIGSVENEIVVKSQTTDIIP